MKQLVKPFQSRNGGETISSIDPAVISDHATTPNSIPERASNFASSRILGTIATLIVLVLCWMVFGGCGRETELKSTNIEQGIHGEQSQVHEISILFQLS